MRLSHTNPSSDLISSYTNPGLPLSWNLVYNDRQKLPHWGSFPLDNSCSTFTNESAMKPSRPDSKPVRSSAQDAPVRNAVETRAERLARIKQEIQAGTYDSDDKLEKAIERMLGVILD